MSENDLKPSLRFKGFTDAWEQRELGGIFDIVTDYVAAGSFADLSENVEYKNYPDYAQLVRTTDLKANFTNTNFVYVNEDAFYYLYRVNLNRESIVLPNIGNCGEVYYIRPSKLPYKNNVLGPNAILIRSSDYDNGYLSYLLQANDFQKKLKLIVSPNGQTKFNKTDLKKIDVISTFDKREQEKIGQMLLDIDCLITLHQHKYEKLQNAKKSLLEKMFPDETSDKPKIRFKGFTDAWEQRKYLNIGDKISTGTLSYSDLNTKGVYNAILYGDLYTTYEFRIDNVKNKTNKKTGSIIKGDILFPSSTTVDALSLISPSCLNVDNAQTGGVFVIRPYSNIDGNFVTIYTRGNMKQKIKLSSKAQGTTIIHIYYQSIKDESIMIPKYEEQIKISKIFKDLDSLITLHQRKYEKLQNIKKSLLERMFI